MKINKHIIKLVDYWQTSYSSIYSPSFIELQKLKTYIKINLANNFIRPSKFPAGALIFFNKKPDESLRLYVDYCSHNILIIQNFYPLFLVRKLLN